MDKRRGYGDANSYSRGSHSHREGSQLNRSYNGSRMDSHRSDHHSAGDDRENHRPHNQFSGENRGNGDNRDYNYRDRGRGTYSNDNYVGSTGSNSASSRQGFNPPSSPRRGNDQSRPQKEYRGNTYNDEYNRSSDSNNRSNGYTNRSNDYTGRRDDYYDRSLNSSREQNFNRNSAHNSNQYRSTYSNGSKNSSRNSSVHNGDLNTSRDSFTREGPSQRSRGQSNRGRSQYDPPPSSNGYRQPNGVASSSRDYSNRDQSFSANRNFDNESARNPSVDRPGSSRQMDNLQNAFQQCQLNVPPVAAAEEKESVFCPKKAPALRHDKEIVELVTNHFTLTPQRYDKVIYRYDLEVRIKVANKKGEVEEFNLTDRCRNDAEQSERHRICVEALRRALVLYNILREGEGICHDEASTLYCTQDLSLALKPHGDRLSLSEADIPVAIRRFIRDPKCDGIELTISVRPDQRSQFLIGDFMKAEYHKISNPDRTVKQFFEVCTSSDASTSGKYVFFGSGRLFDAEENKANKHSLKFGFTQGVGIMKGVKFVEGKKRDGIVPALVLDSKVGTFFKAQNLAVSIRELIRDRRMNYREDRPFSQPVWNLVKKYVTGLRLTLVDNQTVVFVASGISRGTIEHIYKTRRDDLCMTQEESNNCNPNLPAVEFKSNVDNKKYAKIMHYPMERLMVAPNQRVPKELAEKLIGIPKAMHVQERFSRISQNIAALNLESGGARNEALKAFQIEVSMQVKVKGFRRNKPTLVYGGDKAFRPDAKTAGWKLDRDTTFVVPGECAHILFLYNCPENLAKNAINSIKRLLASRGLKIGNYEERAISSSDEMNTAFKYAQKLERNLDGGRVFVVYFDSITIDSHGDLKLYERKYQIISQHVTAEVAERLPRQANTASNVINKMNVKLGGTNCNILPDAYVQSSNKNAMFVGYDVAHPGALSAKCRMGLEPAIFPSVVGFSFNGLKEEGSFIGDFHYQTPLKEQVADTLLNSRMKWALRIFEYNRGMLPDKIIIIRDGVSDGQYRMVATEEFPAIKEACEEFANLSGVQWNPKFVLVVVTKRHHTRLYKDNRNGVGQNAEPCTVVDTEIVRNDVTEFFMMSHKVIQGTGKAPSYVVLQDDLNLSMDEVQSLMLSLCFGHQIVESPISIPEPVYLADEMAKRGNLIYNTYYDKNFPLERIGKAKDAKVDFEKMTELLAYWNTKLEKTRLNA